ncbi:MAG TPA: adenylate/guanylate cyclase domain-containing protein [Saprospiraceae bacterium]|nr:adenylate/guanylate cyclase domain-containing protein [Saprospiraceae bacterium]
MQKLVAVMYTDIVGYTSITEESETMAISLNDKHRQLVKDLVVEFRGTVYEIVGDGSLSYFRSASDCVDCAIALQHQFRKEPMVPVRIGIHIGEIRGDDNLVYGNALNIASRIESMGEPGSILVSRNVVDSISGKSDFLFQPLGSFAFKNVDKPIEIYAVANAGIKVPDPDLVSGKFKILERKDIIVFDEWDDRELIKRLADASLICQQAVCSYGFINYNYSKLRSFIQRGGKFDCVMIHPDSQALKVSPERQAGAASDIAYVQGQLQLSFHKLKPLASGVRFKLTQHLPDPIMTFVDPDTEDGVLFITLTGFRMDLHERPSFVLRKSTHRRWFDFYYASFRKLMDSEETEEVDWGKEWVHHHEGSNED